MVKKKEKQKTCVLYTRVSTEMQVDGYSLEAQENRLRKEAEHRGFEVLKVYPDEGKSGKNIKGRPKFQEMKRDISNPNKETPDYVFVFKLSRFGRNAADTLDSLQFLEDYGVNLLCVEDGIDSAGAAGKLMISVIAAVAEIERENIIAQTMAGRWQKASEGKWNGGFAPYGYKLENGELKIAEDEADLIREIFKLFNEGINGINTVARRLNELGYKKKVRNNANTDRIGASFVKTVLDNPIYAGILPYGRRRTEKIPGTRNEFHVVEHDDYETYEGIHEPIITREMWQKTLKKRKETGYAHDKKYSLEHSHILSGIVKCPVCNASMYGNVNRKKKKDGSGYYKDIWYYVCKNRIKVGGQPCNFRQYVRQDDVNREAFGIIKEIFNRDNVNTSLATDFLSEQMDIDKLNKELEELLEKRKEVDSKRKKLLLKMAEMDADDELYDVMYDNYNGLIRGFSTQIIEIDQKIDEKKINIESNGVRRESVERVRQLVGEMWDHLDELPQEYVKQFMLELISEIHILEQPDVIDGVKYWIKSVKFKVPMLKGTTDEFDTIEVKHIFQPNEQHVETVVSLSRV